MDDQDDDDALFSLSRKKSFGDPAAKKETISHIRKHLESHKGDSKKTDSRHPNRPRRMGSVSKGPSCEEPPRFMGRQSSGDWSSRLGGNPALATQLDFLRDKGREELTKRTATREATHKANLTKPDKHSSQAERDTWRLREEREDYWARTASHH